jgi:transaldolase/glucose-6-phosphate isomerase
LGQSFWLDYIRRDLITSGELQQMVNDGDIRGVTSNPTIFEKAIAGSDLYTPALRPLAHAGRNSETALDSIVIDDIRRATDVFLPLYEASNGSDGFVSIEVNPLLAEDSDATAAEARRLWKAVNRPNAMVKIPATAEGIPAIERCIYEGININVTLIFSLDRYAQVIDAYVRGLEQRLEEGESVGHIASVASFFVSRVDTAVDIQLEEIVRLEGSTAPRAASLMGKIAVANAKMAYAQFKAAFESDRFRYLEEHGAQVQRPLWASTSTKNEAYSDTLYVDELIGRHTVNTLPPKTIDAFRDHGSAELTLEEGFSVARGQIAALETLGISLDAITAKLENDGVASFSKSFETLLTTIDIRRKEVLRELGPLFSSVPEVFEKLAQDEVSARIWKRDSKLWPGDSDFIREQLAWLTFPQSKSLAAHETETFASKVLAKDIHSAAIIAAPGSAAAIGALSSAKRKKSLKQLILQDTPSTEEMLRTARKTPVANSLFVISDETGNSHQAATLLDQHWTRAQNRLKDEAGEHFAALVPDGSPAAQIAEKRKFSEIWEDVDRIGGEYSALARKTLLAAAFLGISPVGLLATASEMAQACRAEVASEDNPGIYLGGMLYALSSRNLGILTDPDIQGLGGWIERFVDQHLLTGRTQTLLDRDSLEDLMPDQWGVIYLRQDGSHAAQIERLYDREVPVLVIDVGSAPEDIGAEIFRWQFGITVAAHAMGENPYKVLQGRQFDQTVRSLTEISTDKGRVAFPKTLWNEAGVSIWSAPGNKGPGHNQDAARWLHAETRDSTRLVISGFRLQNRSFKGSLYELQDAWQKWQISQRSLGRKGAQTLIVMAPIELKLSSESDMLEVVEASTALAKIQYYRDRGWNTYGIFLDTLDDAIKLMDEMAEHFRSDKDKAKNA